MPVGASSLARLMSSTYEELPPSIKISRGSSRGNRSAINVSTTAAGTINHTVRGFWSFSTRSASDDAPTAFSFTKSFTFSGDRLKTTHWWPPLMSRRTMLAPIRPSPTIPICIVVLLFIAHSLLCGRHKPARQSFQEGDDLVFLLIAEAEVPELLSVHGPRILRLRPALHFFPPIASFACG